MPRDTQTIAMLTSAFPSHLFSTFGLARRLQAAGFKVEYWGDPSLQRLVSRQDFTHVSIENVGPCYEPVLPPGRTFMAQLRAFCAAIGQLRKRRRELAADVIAFRASIVKQVARCRPIVVLLDPFAAAYFPLLNEIGLRCILLQDKPAPIELPTAPPPTSRRAPTHGMRWRALNKALWILERTRIGFHQCLRLPLSWAGVYTQGDLIRAIQSSCSLTSRHQHIRRVHYDLIFEQLPEWLIGIPEFDFLPSDLLPPNTRHVGLWTDVGRRESPWPLPDRASGKRLVYVSMGTAPMDWSHDLPLLQHILMVLSRMPDVFAMVSTGHHRSASILRTAFPQFSISAFLPQISLLSLASIAITHGGANSVRECIATRTPMLVFPRGYDQKGNGARVAHHMIGLLGSRQDSAEEISRKVSRLLSDPMFSTRIGVLEKASLRQSETLFAEALATLLEEPFPPAHSGTT